jgi:hypothetical protein
MSCSKCGIRKAVAASGLCLLCLGGVVATSAQPHGHYARAAEITALTASGTLPDHAEQPHPPEMAETQLASPPEAEIIERHVLTLDHPLYGQLNGHNYLGYCDTCPLASREALCYGSCPDGTTVHAD